jgi:putative transposase
MPDIATHSKLLVTLCGFIIDLPFASETSKNCWQQEALPSVTKPSETGARNSGQRFCKLLKKNRGRLGDTWYLDEVFININGVLHYLWRAVDQDGEEIDILVQKRKDKKAARQSFRKLLKGQQAASIRIVTDKSRSYSAAKKELIPDVEHSTQQYENNRCELSHKPSRQQERHMRKFKSQGQAQRFFSCHGVVNNLFRIGRHLMKASHYRVFVTERSLNGIGRVTSKIWHR